MATRSTITLVTPANNMGSIYCHWDGYLSGVGLGLLDHINTPDKVKALIKEGNRSSLDSEPYYKEEGWGGNRPASFIEPQEYNYVYDMAKEQWSVFSMHLDGADTYETRVPLTRDFIGAETKILFDKAVSELKKCPLPQ